MRDNQYRGATWAGWSSCAALWILGTALCCGAALGGDDIRISEAVRRAAD